MNTDKRQWARGDALAVANEVMAELGNKVKRIETVGSVRRRKPTVGDVEILFIPRMERRSLDLLETHEVDTAAEAIEQMLVSGVITRRPSKSAWFTWGPLNKFAVHAASGIPVDFFSEPCADNWWRSLVIRTGPKDFNLRVIAAAARNGISVHAYGAGLTDRKGDVIPCGSELEFLEICGVGWIEPEERK